MAPVSDRWKCDSSQHCVHREDCRGVVARRGSSFAAHEVWPRVPAPQGATSKVFVVPILGGQPRLVCESDLWLDITDPISVLADWTGVRHRNSHESAPATVYSTGEV